MPNFHILTFPALVVTACPSEVAPAACLSRDSHGFSWCPEWRDLVALLLKGPLSFLCLFPGEAASCCPWACLLPWVPAARGSPATLPGEPLPSPRSSFAPSHQPSSFLSQPHVPPGVSILVVRL